MQFIPKGSRFVGNLKLPAIFASILMSGLLSCVSQNAAKKEPQLCQGHYHSEQAAKEQLARFANSYSSLEQWKARTDRIRKGILRGAELLSLPEKSPLHGTFKLRHRGHRVHREINPEVPIPKKFRDGIRDKFR